VESHVLLQAGKFALCPEKPQLGVGRVQEITPDFMHRKNNKSKGFSQAFARLARTQMDAWVASMENAFAQMHSAPGSWGGIFFGGGMSGDTIQRRSVEFSEHSLQSSELGCKRTWVRASALQKKKKNPVCRACNGMLSSPIWTVGSHMVTIFARAAFALSWPFASYLQTFFFLTLAGALVHAVGSPRLPVAQCKPLATHICLWFGANSRRPAANLSPLIYFGVYDN
jgi:hypothetical protein